MWSRWMTWTCGEWISLARSLVYLVLVVLLSNSRYRRDEIAPVDRSSSHDHPPRARDSDGQDRRDRLAASSSSSSGQTNHGPFAIPNHNSFLCQPNLLKLSSL